MKHVNAVIRKNYGIDPLRLSDKEWTTLYNEAVFLQEIENKNLETIITNCLRKVAEEVFKALNKKE